MSNRETLRDFFSLYNKKCISIELRFNDGTSCMYTDYEFTSQLVESIKNGMAKKLMATYVKQTKEKETQK